MVSYIELSISQCWRSFVGGEISNITVFRVIYCHNNIVLGDLEVVLYCYINQILNINILPLVLLEFWYLTLS